MSLFAQDACTHDLLYASADLAKAAQPREVLAFCDRWRAPSGSDPEPLVFDSKLTTQQVLAELDARGVRFPSGPVSVDTAGLGCPCCLYCINLLSL